MSSFNTPPLQTPTADPGATQTSSSDNNGGGGGGISGSSSLYLYTFLATLVLLLTVSGTIVLRSMHIRRRQRAAILAAIANGTYVPPTDGNGRGGLGALLLGEKPKMYEVALVDEKWVEEDKLERQEEESEEGDGLKKEKVLGLWGDITPFSAQFLTSPTTTDKSSPTAGMTASQLSAHRELMGDAPATTGTVSFSSIVGYWRPRRRVETIPIPLSARGNSNGSTATTTNAPDAEAGTGVQEGGYRKKDGTMPVQVAVLISMPSPLHPHSRGSSIASKGHERTMSGDSVASGKRAIKGAGAIGMVGKDEEDIPVVEIGVVSVRVREGP